MLWAIGSGKWSDGSKAVRAVTGAPPEEASNRPPAAEPPIRFSVAASGDLLIHGPVFERARALARGGGYQFRPMFRYVKPTIADADLGICHLETPLTRGQPTGYPVFAAPADLAPAIKDTGWDVCTTASNHSLDRGQTGIDETARVLERAELVDLARRDAGHIGLLHDRHGRAGPRVGRRTLEVSPNAR